MGVPNQKDGSVIRVDPVTGRQSLVSSGGNFYDPAGDRDRPRRHALRARQPRRPQQRSGDQGGSEYRRPQLIASNFTLDPTKLFDLPFGIAVEPDGQIIVVNRSLAGALPVPCLLGTGRVFAVNPVNFLQTPISNPAGSLTRWGGGRHGRQPGGRERVRRRERRRAGADPSQRRPRSTSRPTTRTTCCGRPSGSASTRPATCSSPTTRSAPTATAASSGSIPRPESSRRSPPTACSTTRSGSPSSRIARPPRR